MIWLIMKKGEKKINQKNSSIAFLKNNDCYRLIYQSFLKRLYKYSKFYLTTKGQTIIQWINVAKLDLISSNNT